MKFHFTSPPSNEGVTIPAKIESKADLLAFLERTVPLPDYFGKNWDALEECLGNLEWLDRPKLVLIHHDIPLENTPRDQRLYLEILSASAEKSARLEIVFPESCREQVKRILSLR